MSLELITNQTTGKSIELYCLSITSASGGTNVFGSISLTNTTNQIKFGTTNTTTLSSPAPASSITLTLPSSSSDTILARNTTDTLTNKTLSTGCVVPASLLTGTVGLSNGGTNASITASAGSVAYSTASALGLTAAGSSGQLLQSNGTSAPSWVTMTNINNNSVGGGNSMSQSFTSGMSSACAFNTNDFINNAAMHSTSMNNSRFTAPAAGSYYVQISIPFDTNSNPGSYQLDLLKNGSTQLQTIYRDDMTIDLNETVIAQGFWAGTLAANDYLEVYILQSTGADLISNVYNSGTDVSWARFFMRQIA